MKTIRNYFDEAVEQVPEGIAQRFFERGAWVARTYAALHRRVVSVAGIVRDLGIEPGRHQVALMLENCPEWQEIYLGLACSGVAVVPLDPKLRPQEALHILSDSDTTVIFAGHGQKGLLEEIAEHLPKLRACVWIGEGGKLVGEMKDCVYYAYETLHERISTAYETARDWFEQHRPSPGSVASILYTSGTTGCPKGALLSHLNFTSNVEASIERVGFFRSDNFLNILPLFHSFSFTANFMLPLSLGGCCSFVRSVKTISDDMRELKPTVMLAVPLLAEKLYSRITRRLQSSKAARWLSLIGLKSIIRSSVKRGFGGKLRLIGIGGAPTPQEILRGLQELGIPVLEGYGLTECSPGIAYPNLSNYVVGSVGQILDNIEYKLMDIDSSGAGELYVKGPNVMLGYYKNPGATAEAFDSEGYLRTGDIVREDALGNITICGRRKALIVNREGKNIYPEEIEQVIERSDMVSEVLVLGYHVSGETGERIGAIVVPDEKAILAAGVDADGGGSTPDRGRIAALVRAKIIRLCNENLADYKLPRKVEVRFESLELTSTMKVRRVVYAGTLDED